MTRRYYCVVKEDSVDSHEVAQVILVGNVVAMPCHHIERRVVLYKHTNTLTM